MPVEDHPVHDKVKIDSSFRYGCQNRIFRPHVPVQDGWVTDTQKVGSTVEWVGYKRMTTVDFVMTTVCNYDYIDTDPACEGCKQERRNDK